MGFRFRKSFKIAPGVKVNINKKSVGMTFGAKGAHYTINSKGTRTKSVGIPGTGLSYVDVKNPSKDKVSNSDAPSTRQEMAKGNNKGCGMGCLSLIALIFAIFALVNLFTGHFDNFFGILLLTSVILAITSLFQPKLAFWTQKKTRLRAFLGYLIPVIVFFALIGITTSGGQTNENQANTSGDSVIADSSSSAESSASDDSFDSSSSSSSSSESSSSSSSELSDSSSSSPSTEKVVIAPVKSSSSNAKKQSNSSKKENTRSSSKAVSKSTTPKKSESTSGKSSASKSQQTVTPATSGGTETFKNCTELRKRYPHGVPKGHPAYQPKMDRDKDGYACER